MLTARSWTRACVQPRPTRQRSSARARGSLNTRPSRFGVEQGLWARWPGLARAARVGRPYKLTSGMRAIACDRAQISTHLCPETSFNPTSTAVAMVSHTRFSVLLSFPEASSNLNSYSSIAHSLIRFDPPLSLVGTTNWMQAAVVHMMCCYSRC